MLQVLVLGPPVVLFDDKPLKIQRRQLRTLLYYLACQPEGVGRGELLTRFWPDTNETDARRQLREILSKLRAQIPDPQALQTDHDRVWLNKQSVYSDVQDFLALIQPVQSYFGNSRGKSSLPDSLVEMLEQAEKLWRSPSFLAGVRISNTQEFENWLRERASSLEYNRLECLERLANHYSSLGELDKAIYYVHKALESDDLNEELQAQLLSLLFNSGRISEAQTYYLYLTELYQNEYNDVPPEILKHTIDNATRITFEEKIHPTLNRTWQRNSNQHFVGRKEELQRLKQAYLQGGIVFITGEAGIGKTQIVHQFYNSLENKPRLLLTTCHSQESDLPFQPLVSLIREQISREDWNNLDAQWLKSLSVLVPDVVRKLNSSQFVKDAFSLVDRSDLFESIRQLFLAASHSSQILLVLDDAQWSDVDTLEAFMYLFESKFFNDHGFFILNTRLDIQNPRVQDLLITDKKHHQINRINLKSITEEETAELARYTLGQIPTEEFVNRLYQATGGNPLFIIETINTLLMSSNDFLSIQQEDLPLADSVSFIISDNEKQLSESARQILSAAAICGMEFQIEVLEQLEWYEPEILVRSL
ncbi:MAG TPA: AAA family ATPase, partial [Leptolinea sp.]